MRGVAATRIADIKAVTSELTITEKRALLESLTSEIQAATAAVDAPKRRLAAVQAASTATDPRTKAAFKVCSHGLGKTRRMRLSVRVSGNVAELDKKMKEFKWHPEQRIRLKHSLAVIGALGCRTTGPITIAAY